MHGSFQHYLTGYLRIRIHNSCTTFRESTSRKGKFRSKLYVSQKILIAFGRSRAVDRVVIQSLPVERIYRNKRNRFICSTYCKPQVNCCCLCIGVCICTAVQVASVCRVIEHETELSCSFLISCITCLKKVSYLNVNSSALCSVVYRAFSYERCRCIHAAHSSAYVV